MGFGPKQSRRAGQRTREGGSHKVFARTDFNPKILHHCLARSDEPDVGLFGREEVQALATRLGTKFYLVSVGRPGSEDPPMNVDNGMLFARCCSMLPIITISFAVIF